MMNDSTALKLDGKPGSEGVIGCHKASMRQSGTLPEQGCRYNFSLGSSQLICIPRVLK